MKRFFIFVSFLFFGSSALASDDCKIVEREVYQPLSFEELYFKVMDDSVIPPSCDSVKEDYSGYCYKSHSFVKDSDTKYSVTFLMGYHTRYRGITDTWTRSGSFEYQKVIVEETVCPKPDVSKDGWCREGYSSPIYVPSPSMLKNLAGRPVVSLRCDDPPFEDLIYYDSWDDYASNKNPKSYSDLENTSEGGGGLGTEGGTSGSGGDPEVPSNGNGQSQVTMEDILQAVNFANQNSTKSTIDAINFSNDAIARAVRDGIDSSSIGSGGSGGSGSGSGSEGSGSDLEIPEGLLTEEYLDGLFSGFISDAQNIDDSDLDDSNVKEIDVSQLGKTYNVKLLASKQCPAPIPISFSMFGHAYNYYLTFDYLCMFADVVGKLLLAAAYFSAAFIVARVSRR